MNGLVLYNTHTICIPHICRYDLATRASGGVMKACISALISARLSDGVEVKVNYVY